MGKASVSIAKLTMLNIIIICITVLISIAGFSFALWTYMDTRKILRERDGG